MFFYSSQPNPWPCGTVTNTVTNTIYRTTNFVVYVATPCPPAPALPTVSAWQLTTIIGGKNAQALEKRYRGNVIVP